MKSKFYSLSGSWLTYFIFLIVFNCIYLYAEEKYDCCDVKFSECENTQNAVSMMSSTGTSADSLSFILFRDPKGNHKCSSS